MAVSDPASLDGGLAGNDQEVPISYSSAKQRHRRWCWKASPPFFKISSCRLVSALQLNQVKMEGCRVTGSAEGGKSWAKAGKSLPFVCHLSSFT